MHGGWKQLETSEVYFGSLKTLILSVKLGNVCDGTSLEKKIDIFVRVKYFITHNTRILFHKAHLYKSIRFIFTCEKSLYSQSELRTAISHVEFNQSIRNNT